MASRFIMTIDDDAAHPASSDSEVDTDSEVNDGKSSTTKTATSKSKRKKNAAKSEDRLDMDFDFAADDITESSGGTSWGDFNDNGQNNIAIGKVNNTERKIADVLEDEGGAMLSDSDAEDESEKKEGSSEGMQQGGTKQSTRKQVGEDTDSEDSDDEDDEDAEARKREFFSEVPDDVDANTFAKMELSRPLLRGITAMKFISPSLVQQRAIPVALMGRDLCACATTGSGKTAAFMLPVLERLLFRPKKVAQTRVLVLSPTRELAVQVFDMSKKLAQYTDIEFGLAVGGMALRVQEAELRARPDIVVATPGRLVDHITNTFGFTLDGVEILVLDEADRLLEVGFKDELNSIIKACPRHRQTMLFSATMTDEVEDLVSLSLHEPVRLFINRNSQVTSNLTQEFVRIRKQRENCRESIVLALCSRIYTSKCLVFVRSKVLAHRLRVIFGLAGLSAVELHGALSQAQRLESLARFTKHEVDFLIATDLAGRGIDIKGIEAVINMSMPHTLKQYIHRVGRTARAGSVGRSVTLVGENERKILRQIVKSATGNLKSRIVAPKVIDKFKRNIDKMEPAIRRVLEEEKMDKEMDQAEMEATKASNLLEHRDEIMARAPRTWITSQKGKEDTSKLSAAAHIGEVAGADDAVTSEKPKSFKAMTRKERKRARSDGVKIDGAAAATIRAVKRARKPTKITVFEEDKPAAKGANLPQQKKKKKKAAGFESEIRKGVANKPGEGTRSGGGKGKGKSAKDDRPLSKQEKKALNKKVSVNKFKSKSKYKRR
eukprot:m.671598 g.671598  ORF g.671598 m.671598 type:complete len:776 (+) comp22774_c0_seq3:184-2511(+)